MVYIIDRTRLTELLPAVNITDISSLMITGQMVYQGTPGILRIVVDPMTGLLFISFNDEQIDDYDHYRMTITVGNAVIQHNGGLIIDHVDVEEFSRNGITVKDWTVSDDGLSMELVIDDESKFNIWVDNRDGPRAAVNGFSVELSARPWLYRCFEATD